MSGDCAPAAALKWTLPGKTASSASRLSTRTLGGKCLVRSATPAVLKSGWFGPKAQTVESGAGGTIDFETKAGQTYVIVAD